MVTAAAFFDAARSLPLAPVAAIVGPGGIVVVAPHPDDETLGCGGLLATANAEGRQIRIVVLSDGCGSHPNSPTHPPERLRALREEETRDAVAALGLDASLVSFLGLPDRSLPGDGPAAETVARGIAAAASDIGASAILATWGRDPHCDHQAAWRIAARARALAGDGVALLAYPIWGEALPPQTPLPQPPQGWRLSIDAVAARKQAAIAAYVSQISTAIENDPPVQILTAETLARFRTPFEIYLKAEA